MHPGGGAQALCPSSVAVAAAKTGDSHHVPQSKPTDALSGLYPTTANGLPVAWSQVRIPGPPPVFALTTEEQEHPDPATRYRRRLIQAIEASGARFGLIDKASPHALYDLMVSALHQPPQPAPTGSSALGGQLLWRSAASFVQFVSRSDVMRGFDLDGGRLHIALNCDPGTQDRESCQANKQLHIHLLYWRREELAALSGAGTLGEIEDLRLRRQSLDPLAFVGAHLIRDALGDLPLGIHGAELLPVDDQAVIEGRQPLGCLLRLPGWGVLDDPAFEALVRHIHQRLEQAGAQVLAAFTGETAPPPPWRRHSLLPRPQIRENLRRLSWSEPSRAGLAHLAERLRDLRPALADRFRRGAPGRRKHHMSLNLPCYSLNLYAPFSNTRGRTVRDAETLYLILQTKLFSAIGGAGLVGLGRVPSVRILRGIGSFEPESWHRRARFQRAFAGYNTGRLAGTTGLEFGPVRRFADLEQGWREA